MIIRRFSSRSSRQFPSLMSLSLPPFIYLNVIDSPEASNVTELRSRAKPLIYVWFSLKIGVFLLSAQASNWVNWQVSSRGKICEKKKEKGARIRAINFVTDPRLALVNRVAKYSSWISARLEGWIKTLQLGPRQTWFFDIKVSARDRRVTLGIRKANIYLSRVYFIN